MDKKDLKDFLYSCYYDNEDVQGEIMSLKESGDITLDDAYEALKDLYNSGKIRSIHGKGTFENSFSRGGRGNKVLVMYANHFELND